MTAYLRGDPVWVIVGLTQSVDDNGGGVTVASEVFAVAPSLQVAEDLLYHHGRSVDSSVIELRIEESTLVDR